MQALDTTIANVALPRMQGTLSATQDEMGWVLTSYIVAAAITIPLTGWLAGQFGRRRVFLISIFIFTVASALCGLAVSLPQIVLFRFLQGRGRRGAGAAVPGGAVRHQPAQGFRPRHGDLGHRRHHGSDPGTGAGRLADRELHLALGVLHQPADRHTGLHRPLFHLAGKSQRPRIALRFLRFHQPQRLHRRAAADAGPGPAAGLVLVARDHDRGDRRRRRPSICSWFTPFPTPNPFSIRICSRTAISSPPTSSSSWWAWSCSPPWRWCRRCCRTRCNIRWC